MNLSINKTSISQDDFGRFAINDLHKAAGGNDKDRPSYYYRSKNFKDTVNVLTVQNRTLDPIVKKTGRWNGGTWVSEELVIDYAMWVSPEFKVKVIQTFLAFSKGDYDKAHAILSNDKEQLDIITRRDKIMSSKISSGKKADKLTLLEKEWIAIGSSAGKSLSIRRGQSFKFIEAQDSLLNDIQTSFEF